MADVFTPLQRSAVMARVRARNTAPELVVRRTLHALGYRFRTHVAGLPGKPDIVLNRYGAVFEVRGCFWHGHRCAAGDQPASHRAYWVPKLAGNKARDRRNARRLRALGWKVATVWECHVRRWTHDQLAARLQAVLGD
jgi:DNA mismatch endonuclease (patch repair protein)